MNVTKFGQIAQLVLAVAAIIAVTVLCLAGKVDGATVVLVIVSAGGISALGSANVHLAEQVGNQSEPDSTRAPAPPHFDPNGVNNNKRV